LAIFLTDSRKLVHNRAVCTTFDAEPLPRGAALRVASPRVAVTAVHEHPHADTDSIVRIVPRELGVDEAEVVTWGLSPACCTSADS
jgi:Fur family ferric uptake transcriptional regulator